MILCLDWDQDLEEGTQEVAGEAQLRKYGKFVENYATQLTSIEDTLEVKSVDILDKAVDPIYLNYTPLENAAISQLIDTDNKVLQKVLTVLASLCAEVKILQQEARDNFFYSLLYFGEGGDEKEALMQMSYILPHLQELSCFIKRCEQVVGNITQQLSALYTSSKEVSQVINANNIHFQDVFDSLGDLLVVLVTLDAIITNNNTLLNYWQLYAHTLKSVNHNPSNFGLSQEKLKMFGKVLFELENQVLTGNIFKKSLEQSYGNNRPALCKNVALAEEFESYLKNCLNELDVKTNEKLDCENTMTWIKTSVLFVMHFNIFGSSDKKLLKQLLDLNKKIPGITLVGYIMWYPEKFLLSHIPSLSKIIDKKTIQQTESLRLNYLQQKAQNLLKELHLLSLQICSWIVKFETFVKRSSSHSTTQDISNGCHLFEQGLQFAGLLSYTLKNVMNLHLALSKPVTKTEVVSLFKLIELLKSVQFMFDRHNLIIGEIISQNTQHLSHQALKLILNAKKLLVQDKCYSEKHLDILSSLILAEKALHGPGTKERRLIIRLAICWANQMHTFSEEPCLVIANILRNLNIMCEVQERLAMICDCSFLYWHRILLPIYFSNIYDNKSDFNCMVYIFSALQDCIPVMKRAKQYPSPEIIINAFKKEVSQQFQKHVVEPLCHSIETDLRLHVHSHLQLDDSNPFNVGICDFSPLLRVCSLRLFNNFIDIKGYVENYLNETFYNLTTVALHDWKTYGEMRTLARYKFNLDTVEDHLPSQTLEQGLDVLEIMRNIHVFVSKYLYNLNNQIFVEKSSKNKHLNTINIKHVANSIRTHGSGIMNTTVNFTYQFLQKKFYIFSQFMFDEHIKSRLIKDIRYFREAKTALEQKYPFERGDNYNRGIRKLGLTDNGLSYLDKFRELITHIGNAMGYVQMIRLGGMHSCSNAISFIPDLEDIISFEGLSREVGLSNICSETASRLDQVISNLTQNLEEGTEYFKLLVDVFVPTFRDSKNIHLKNFYIIVPPLTINFVEHIITAKENMSKKNKTGAAFTDDGFVVGIAYILKLLDQYTEFYSLHWFESVQDKYHNDISALLHEKSSISKDDETLQQTMTLTEKRLLKYKQEFELLNCNLTSVKIFFETSEHQENAAS